MISNTKSYTKSDSSAIMHLTPSGLHYSKKSSVYLPVKSCIISLLKVSYTPYSLLFCYHQSILIINYFIETWGRWHTICNACSTSSNRSTWWHSCCSSIVKISIHLFDRFQIIVNIFQLPFVRIHAHVFYTSNLTCRKNPYKGQSCPNILWSILSLYYICRFVCSNCIENHFL